MPQSATFSYKETLGGGDAVLSHDESRTSDRRAPRRHGVPVDKPQSRFWISELQWAEALTVTPRATTASSVSASRHPLLRSQVASLGRCCHALKLVSPPAPGLRTRKKLKTRLAIYDAALELFAQQGFEATTVEQIAQQAEVSTATFFRYFPNKGDVIYSSSGFEIDILEQAIIERPTSEDDLTAIRRAVVDRWVPALDRERVARQVRAAAKSPMLRGMSTNLSVQWQAVIISALQTRRGITGVDPVCRITSFVALAVFSSASSSWMEREFRTEFADELDQEFDRLANLCADWSRFGRVGRDRVEMSGHLMGTQPE